MKHQVGFSLVEIMLGMTLGLFLTIGIIQLYIGSNRNYGFQEAFAITQENGRFALELLNNSIRMTNFTGCAANGQGNIVTNALDLDLNNNDNWWANVTQNWNGMLRGFDGNTNFPGKAFRTNIPGNMGERIEDTDAIISLGGTGSYSITAATAQNFTLSQIQKINGGNIQRGDILWICDTTNVVLFQVTGINGNTITHDETGAPGNNSPDFPIVYAPNTAIDYATEVTEYVPIAFYIGVSASGTSRSLFQIQLEIINGVTIMQAEEMVVGVENMQIFYGEDINSDNIVDTYVDASDVTNWSRVVSVRIELLLASEDNVLSTEHTYLFPRDRGDSAINGRRVPVPVTNPRDLRWFQTFSTTIGIRNRLM